jgi:uroporphyrinogen-III decarboxylase
MLRSLEAIGDVAEPEFMTFAEDMSGKTGPMLSEKLFDEFMLPYYRRVVPEIERRGIVPLVDTDGDVTRAVPWLLRAGVRGLLPMERRAGVDVAALRRSYPDLVMVGGLDKSVMAEGDAAVCAELERLLLVARSGRFAISVDHQTPPHVSLAQYRRFVDLFRQYAPLVANG